MNKYIMGLVIGKLIFWGVLFGGNSSSFPITNEYKNVRYEKIMEEYKNIQLEERRKEEERKKAELLKKKKLEEERRKKEKEKKGIVFELTFYTSLPSENGGYATTSTGSPLKYGVVASNVRAPNTKIYLEGYGNFTVLDTGGSEFNSSHRLDVLIERKAGESDEDYIRRVQKMGRKKVRGYIKN